MSAEQFLNTLFHDKPDSETILIWEKYKDKKLSYWFRHTADAIKFFQSQGKNQDTYVGCGTASKALTAFRRCKANEISGIPAAWLDIDILDPAHSKPNLPENSLKAMEIVEPFPLKPTIIVNSGHGFQCWWVFNKFGKFSNPHMREEAADLIHKFTWTMRDFARSMGYDLDMTFDLSRVFRIPGGMNYKNEPFVPVIMEKCGTNFYTPREFNDAIDAFRVSIGHDATPIDERKKPVVLQVAVVEGERFKLDPNAEPPLDKLDALIEFEPKFSQSWEHRRKDFKSGAESASEYDFSLASFAHHADWSEQEIVDLMIAFRRKHGLKQKLVYDYYRRTLDKVKADSEYDKAYDIIDDFITAKREGKLDVSGLQQKRLEARNAIRRLIGLDIERLLKYMSEPPEYRIETDRGSIHLGLIQNLIEQSYFRRRIADAANIYIPPMKSDKWSKIAQALLDMLEEVYTGEETRTRGLVKSWLIDYLGGNTPLYNQEDALLNHRSFYAGNRLYINGSELRKFVAMHRREIISSKQMGIMLREYGMIPESKNIKINGRYNSRTVWGVDISTDKTAQQFVNYELLKEANSAAIAASVQKEEEAQ